MARAPSHTVDPALDAAALLRRVGFFGLFFVVPVAAQVARRASVVIAPIAVILLVIASAIDRQHRPLRSSLALLRAPAAVAGLLLIGWTGLSLVWTPFPIQATERFSNILATILLTVAGYLAVPDRMRSANLYLLPIGIAAGALVAIATGLFQYAMVDIAPDGDTAPSRGAVLLAVLGWPAISWLRSRGRDLEALGLALLVTGAAVIAGAPMPLLALALGALVFGLTSQRLGLGTRLTAGALGAIMALAPLVPLIGRPIAVGLFGKSGPDAQALIAWQKLVTAEPLRLVTGHGFETALRGRFVGMVPPSAPNSVLFEMWYELGVVGALAAAFALYAALRRAADASAPVVPGIMAACVTAFTLCCVGLRPTVAWWLTAMILTVLAFLAVERGQFRSRRPKVRIAPQVGGDP